MDEYQTMITNQVYYGIVFAVLTSQAFANNICNNTYTNGIGIQCLPCEPGYIAIGDCPGNITRAKCEECKDGTYQPECVTFNETVSCRNCTVCDVYKENCTIYKDAVCELKHDTRDSSDDSGAQLFFVVGLMFLTGSLILVIIIAVLVCCLKRSRKVRKYWIMQSKYGKENLMANCKVTPISWKTLSSPKSQTRSDGNRQEHYNQTNKRFSEDVVQKTSINDYKDKSSIHNVDGNDLAPRSNKKERHIAVVRPNFESKSNDCKEVENSDDFYSKNKESSGLRRTPRIPQGEKPFIN
ncbi:uncharacterized protein LOC132734944 [Ruditapes philippinarum]|uniref:uncharacterized protein LOC132734944 n=1 Tax=Ruditapes philippinarum TaxID=129788 RepID=UPI00295AFE94|nr:uncharacterized protein LOC132734944 [Ruditapes philippinarum]